MIKVIAITQSEAVSLGGYPLQFFDTMDAARTKLKSIHEIALDVPGKIIKFDNDELTFKRWYQMHNEHIIFYLKIEELSLADALNKMRFVRTAIIEMDFLKRAGDAF